MILPTCCFAPRHQYQQRINLSGAKAGREAEREEGVWKNRPLPSPSLSVSLQMPTAPPPMSLSRSWGCSEPQFLSLESPQPSGQCHTHQKHLIGHLHKLSRPKPLSPFLVSLLHAPQVGSAQMGPHLGDANTEFGKRKSFIQGARVCCAVIRASALHVAFRKPQSVNSHSP